MMIWKKAFKKIQMFFIVCLSIIILLIILSQFLTPLLQSYQQDIVKRLKEQTGQQVEIGSVAVKWHHAKPYVEVNNIHLSNPVNHQSIAYVSQLDIGINFISSLRAWRLLPGEIKLGPSRIVVPSQVYTYLKSPNLTHFDSVNFLKAWYFIQKIAGDDIDLVLDPQTTVHFSFSIAHHKPYLGPEITGKFRTPFIDMDKLQALLPNHYIPLSGEFRDLTLKFGLDNTFLPKFLNLEFSATHLLVHPDLIPFEKTIPFIRGRFEVKRLTEGWFLIGHKVALNPKKAGGDFSLRLNLQEKTFTAKINHINLQVINDAAKALTISSLFKLQNELRLFEPQGEIADLTLKASFATWPGKFELQTDLRHFAIKAHGNIPGINHLSGHIKANEEKGQLDLSLEDAILNLPSLFKQPLLIEDAKTTLNYVKTADNLQLLAPVIDIDLLEGSITADLNLTLPNNGEPILRLIAQTELAGLTSKAIKEYLPIGIMTQDVIDWLEQSIQRVDELKASLKLQGLINEFPFDKHEGDFLVDAEVKDAVLQYDPLWPSISELNGALHFHNRDLKITHLTGMMQGLKISEGNALIAKMGTDEPLDLVLQASARGSLPDVLIFLSHTPLKEKIAPLNKVSTQGLTLINLGLRVPLDDSKRDVQIKGAASLRNAALTYRNIGVNHLNGHLAFTDTQVTTHDLIGNFLGNPIKLIAEPYVDNDAHKGTKFSVNTMINLATINKLLTLRMPAFIKGQLPLQITGYFFNEGKNQINVESNLRGLALNAPYPFNKKINEIANLRITLKEEKNQVYEVTSNYHDQVNLQAVLDLKQEQPFSEGDLQINLPSLPVKAWQDFLNKQTALTKTSLPFKTVTLAIDEITLFDQKLHGLKVSLQNAVSQKNLVIDAKEIRGKIGISNNKIITVDLDKLYLSKRTASREKPTMNNDLSINFVCRDFEYDQMQLGKVTLRLTPNASGAVINQLSLDAPHYHLSAGGMWNKASDLSRIRGVFTSNNVENFLKNLKMPASLISQNARLSFDLNWLGAPFAFNLATLKGNLHLDIQGGNIVNLSKSTDAKLGFVRMLNLFSLQIIPEIFSLNKSHQGFTFKKFQGDFSVRNGLLSTENAYLDGSVAYVSFKGSMDLIKENYNLVLVVLPHITSSLPTIATLAGGPVVGAVAFVADKVIGSGISHIVKYTYSVTGNWANPVVRKTSSSNVPGQTVSEKEKSK